MQTLKNELLELLGRNDLLNATLLVGRVQDPSFNSKVYGEKLMELAAAVWNRCRTAKKDPIQKIQAINVVLFKEFGIQAKNEKYKQVIDDPLRYYLHQVLDRKQGCPLSVTALYMILAEQVGLPVECLALPNYYLLKVDDVTGEFYIDPFDSGKLLTSEEYHRKFKLGLERNRMIQTNLFEKINTYQLVARIVQQLKHIYILKGDALTALRAVEILSALFPQSPEITRDRGILYCVMEYFSKAMEDLRYYLKQRPQAEDVAEIKKLTSMLKGYREIMN